MKSQSAASFIRKRASAAIALAVQLRSIVLWESMNFMHVAGKQVVSCNHLSQILERELLWGIPLSANESAA